jgi:hypothetical protein
MEAKENNADRPSFLLSARTFARTRNGQLTRAIKTKKIIVTPTQPTSQPTNQPTQPTPLL